MKKTLKIGCLYPFLALLGISINMLGFIKISPQIKNIASINYLYFNQGKSPLIWVVAKIAQIDPPNPSNRYSGQWGINLTDIQVGLVSE